MCVSEVQVSDECEVEDLTHNPAYAEYVQQGPQVLMPEAIDPAEAFLFNFDAGDGPSCTRPPVSNSSPPDHNWRLRFEGADLRASYEPSPFARVRLTPKAEPQHEWLRHRDGQWQRKVLINNLAVKPQYNGLYAWAPIASLDQCTADRPSLISVELVDSSQKLAVSSTHLFLVCPHLLPRPLTEALVLIEVWLTPPHGVQPVRARLVVDSGCQLEGVLSSDFVQRWGWETLPSLTTVRTASGERIAGVRHLLANTRFTPTFTHRVAFGVLDLPGFDGLLGVGFLNKFTPYAITVQDATHKSVQWTVPKTKEIISVPGLVTSLVDSPDQGPSVSEQTPLPCLAVQWEPPSAEDLSNVVGIFQLVLDSSETGVELACLPPHEIPPAGGSPYAEFLLAEELEGAVFLATASVANTAQFQHIPEAQRLAFQLVLEQFRQTVFKDCDFPPFPPLREVEFRIELEPNAQVPASPVHKLSPALIEQLRSMLKELLHNGLIVPTASPFAAPLLMVKKPDGSYRICIDYRKLNAVTVKDKYPLPNPEMLFDKLAGCQYFSHLDLRWGYYQVRTAESDVLKTAFRTPFGAFAWKVMGMGLANAAPTFQRMMDSIFRDLDFVSVYLDDILIASRSAEEHLEHLKIVLQRLQDHQLIARESKCRFFQQQVKFLGFVFSAEGRAVDSSKTAALCQMSPPTTVHGLQRWLGMINYYSSFIPKYAHMVAPLTELLKGHPHGSKPRSAAKLEWSDLHQKAFEQVVAALAKPPILKLFDPSCPSRVAADASSVAIGGVLEQEHGDHWHPVAFYSRKLSPAETRYTTRERECLAVKQCLVVWRHYLLGAPFRVLSDHQSLKWLQTQNVNTLSDRLLRWVEFFSLFEFDQDYVPGELNVLPDHLSRPATEVLLVTDNGQICQFDLSSLAVFLDTYQEIMPPSSLLCPVFSESLIETEFITKLRQAQAANPEIAQLTAALLANPVQPPAARLLYQVADGLLVVPEADGRQRIVVPPNTLQQDICKFFHDEGGHPGVHRTISSIATYFFWPKMGSEIRAFVTSCEACQAAKASSRLPRGHAQPHPLPAEPGAHWTLDFLDLPTSANGFKCMLTFTDRLSKLVVLVPLKQTTVIDVAQAYVEHVFCWFGAPLSICSDRGPPFHSAVMHEIFQLIGSSVRHSTPHTPHSHGDIERQHRIVNEIHRALNQDQFPHIAARWDEYAKIMQFMLNSAVVTRHGMSPLFFFFGRQPRLPAATALPSSTLDPASIEFVTSFQTRLQEALDLGRLGQAKMIAAMDELRDPTQSLAVGDWAYIEADETPIPGNAHFRVKYAGPFPVTAVTATNATLELPEHWQLSTSTFHVNKLKKHIAREGAPVPPPIRPRRLRNRPDHNIGEISRISDHRRTGRLMADGRRDTLQFFVHWKGLPVAYGEWLSEAALLRLPFAQAHIQTYLRATNLADP